MKKKSNVLDLLINASKFDGGIDDRGIREEVDTFVYAVMKIYQKIK